MLNLYKLLAFQMFLDLNQFSDLNLSKFRLFEQIKISIILIPLFLTFLHLFLLVLSSFIILINIGYYFID